MADKMWRMFSYPPLSTNPLQSSTYPVILLNVLRTPFRAACIALAAAASQAQTPPPAPDPAIPPTIVHHPRPHTPAPPVMNLNLVVLDPAHGAADNGATFAGNTFEKDVTLALATRLQTLLATRGFTVVLTRSNSQDDVAPDARVELANRSHALACIVLHAASGGHGVHLYASSLTPAAPQSTAPDAPFHIVAWDTAQAEVLTQSLHLADDFSTALNGIRVPLYSGRASIRPLDSLTCPAIALEFAPLSAKGDVNTPVTDTNYQTRLAEAITSALDLWRGHAQAALAAAQAANPTKVPLTTPKPKPKPKPATPALAPVAPGPAAKPAPVVRPAPAQTGSPQ